MSLTGNAESGYKLRGQLSGLERIRGYSAYEVAVLNGFTGTEAEWLASLHGYGGIINDLTTGGNTLALSAEMGKELENTKASKKALHGVRRKIAALGGYVDDLRDIHRSDVSGINKILNREVYYLNTDKLSENVIRIYHGEGAALREFSISLTDDNFKYEISGFSGYSFYRRSVYSTLTSNKTLVGLWVDGTRYDSFNVLRDENLRYRHLMWLYTVNVTDETTGKEYTVNVCTRLNTDQLQIYESIPEDLEALGVDNPLKKAENPKMCIYSQGNNNVFPLVPVGNQFEVFVPTASGGRYLIEKVDDYGQTVVKTFYFH